ncbi:MAG TPA: hypothetical protein VEX64_09185, partial [Pyrinomonadaceae bacterium]|nr:hypothetical protein [Pyrinomonadaceae bacterium]
MAIDFFLKIIPLPKRFMKTVFLITALILIANQPALSQKSDSAALQQLSQQVQNLKNNGKIDEAIVVANRAVELHKNSNDTKSREYTVALLNLGYLKRLRVENSYKELSQKKFKDIKLSRYR